MRKYWLNAVIVTGILATPAIARQDDKAITNRDPDAVDVAKTPMNDLNVGRDGEIPALLVKATAQPYAMAGLGKCRQIAGAIQELDEVLGPDIDLPQAERDRISAGRVGKWVVASFIPFRGLIREVSGANAQDRKVNAAIQAGLTRRGYLKGLGQAKGCRYPASPAPASVVQARLDEIKSMAKKDAKGGKKKGKDDGELAFKSEPDVRQPVPKN
ncbi:hypothetical protein [Novosphingobium sp. P6W]|uniref:hypothetical protein n=1 Tax=Novosphingobium sp. P6W TaxID=1609758 RepID=UPI0005C2FC9F|nr:hypothetical protein [Novosphingobium sp. P6W]AXB76896.1 hypothetical protein TQ38_010640 [Novosphingobium sp. P6W]KIS33261.1 hypothetical protein TQ38_07490 [Novosphingobium sp. P6W]